MYGKLEICMVQLYHCLQKAGGSCRNFWLKLINLSVFFIRYQEYVGIKTGSEVIWWCQLNGVLLQDCFKMLNKGCQ